MSESSRVSNKEGIIDNLQENVVDNKDFSGVTGNIFPGWDSFLALLGNSAYMVHADNVLDSICQVFLAQAWSADWAMEEFCKEMEQGQTRKEGIQGDMNEMVESLWEDTNNLQDDMAKVMVYARANEATAAKMLQSITSLKATAAALVMAVNDLIPMAWHQGALLQDMQQDHAKFWQEMLPLLMSTVQQCNTTMEEIQRDQIKLRQTISNPSPHDVSDHAASPSGGENVYHCRFRCKQPATGQNVGQLCPKQRA